MKTWISIPLSTTFDKNDTFVKDFLKGPADSQETKAQLEIEVKNFIASWLSQHRIPFSVDDPIMNSVKANIEQLREEQAPKNQPNPASLERNMLLAAERSTLRAALKLVFDEFAIQTGELVEHGIAANQEHALKILKKLEAKGLVVGESNDGNGRFVGNDQQKVPGKQKVWQAFETYDNFKWEQIEARFIQEFPFTPEMEAAAKAAQPVGEPVEGPVGLVLNGALIAGPEVKK